MHSHPPVLRLEVDSGQWYMPVAASVRITELAQVPRLSTERLLPELFGLLGSYYTTVDPVNCYLLN